MSTGKWKEWSKFFKFQSMKIDENEAYLQYLKGFLLYVLQGHSLSVTMQAHSSVCVSYISESFSH